ncbi:RIIA lysis inhibitor [Vibrio phage PWH3a-P1]|uniref:RIIA lysis inhibitor n=1 Tax=Vibrio phage PWH3a-P1 TaxID=754058 RepID=UPI0002C047E9|nr:RIIA lysis inhibitor [Vibrio phage PWH3a-P1]AGH31945.1 rIIA [Vibrio phage PWH3a-P1]
MAVPVTPEYEVNVGKSSRSEVCGMEMNASVVKAVTATLYDYKIEAVVREYATNITDSHNDSGNEGLQGYVQVPTKMNPVIEFHDYGLGMTEDTIYSVYTVLGKSTKRGDNKTNGSLGFGSKSYGTVCDQMTVSSIKDGVKVIVVCYKDRTGMLAADTKSVTKTDQPNGTVVSIPVNLNKIDEWQEACARVLGAFRVPHKVNTFGDYQRVFDEVRIMCLNVREKGSMFIQKPSHQLATHRSNTLVLMGDVLYHLPDFDKLLGNTKIKSLVSTLVDSGMYVTNFNIGDLDHAPSREAISYDPQTFAKVRKRVNSDIKREYRKFAKEIEIGGDVSFYKFYKQYRNSSVWEMMKNLQLPFTKGWELYKIDPSNAHNYSYKKIMYLLGDKYGKIRGIVPDASNYNTVFSYTVDSFYQDRLVNITNPVVVYSELEKGLYKMKETLENIHKEKERYVLYTESKTKAQNLANWFGVEGVICGDTYSPEKTKRKGSSNKRGSYGIKSDLETVATYITVSEDGDYSQVTGKLDLTEGGLYYVDRGEDIIIKGIVPKQETRFSSSSQRTLSEMLKLVSGKKVVIRNQNNKGKISRAGVKPLSVAVRDEIKSIKPDLTKYLAQHVRHNGFTKKETVLIKNKPILAKVKNKLDSVEVVNDKVELAANLSKFALNKTKSYEKYRDSKLKVYNKLKSDVESVMEKLPLADKFYDYETEDFEYYLKLEKVIK